MKIKLAIFLFFASIYVCKSQEKLSSEERELLVEKVEQAAKQTHSIVSDFLQEKHLSVLNNTVISEGKMAFSMPDKIRWEYLHPKPQVSVFKEDKLFVREGSKTNDFDLSSNKTFRGFSNLIVNSIKGDMFDETKFNITYLKLAGDYVVNFVPKDKRLRKLISSFEVQFDKNTAEVKQVKLIESETDFTLIKFSNRKTNVTVPESMFQL